MPDDVNTAAGVTEFEAESWPLEAAAEGLHQVIDGFQNGDTRPLVIGDGDQPVLVVLAIADLADFRGRIAELLGNPVDAGWLRYYLRSTFDMSSETLVEHDQIVELATRKVLRRIAVQGAPRRIAFSPNGEQAYITNEWNWLTVIW